jgi:uncharacterized protein YgbK (DUF1537 family)
MTCHVGMVADDLTGALDAAAPFAARGLRTLVVLSPFGLETADRARLREAEVICINTASREIPAEEARRRVLAATTELMALTPGLLFKKVDSRLKGHVGVETGAMLQLSGRARALVAPAIPDLGRVVVDGAVTGKGVATPIPVADGFGGLPVTCPDTRDDAGLAEAAVDVADHADAVLAVGARGLAQALAARFAPRDIAAAPIPLPEPTLVAIGSRDPITRAQIEAVMASATPQRVLAPNGRITSQVTPSALTLITAEPAEPAEAGAVVAGRFADGLAEIIRDAVPASLLVSGGETAYAVLTRLGVDSVDLLGEALPGIPYARARIGGKQVVILTKSGGFGEPDAISLLVRQGVALD